ncbi:TIGR02328 family protein [Sporosarcina sp. FSL W8-0480]|uniref:TIGR02328 family protein n=1 Tax=Sporosarcina sp. FSL W8-0480 TaxID=2954701 RepID=UPI0030D86E35
MRLWHEELISKLPRQQLLGQHRECCALRGLGWRKKHATVDYVFEYSPLKLYHYHMKVMGEMKRRGYQNDLKWEDPAYRGKNCPPYDHLIESPDDTLKYPEHNGKYLTECLENLADKGIHIPQ